MTMDPYEIFIDQLFMTRLEIAKDIVTERRKCIPPANTDYIPFDVNQTMNYIKLDNYYRQKNKLNK